MVAKWNASKICATRESEIRIDRRWKDYPLHVFDVSDINALIQAIGYLKFITDGKVYFRGQSRIYENQGRIFPLPSLLRRSVWKNTSVDEKDAAAVDDAARDRIYKIISLAGEWPASLDVRNCKERILLQNDTMMGNDNLACWDVPLYTVEPLLQHYGMETRWLDLTESLPYALFFGLVRYGSRIAVSDADVADPTNVHGGEYISTTGESPASLRCSRTFPCTFPTSMIFPSMRITYISMRFRRVFHCHP